MKKLPLIKGDIEFSVLGSRDIVKDKTVQYFSDSGYKLVKEKENILFFRRGSVFLNGFTFNPLQVKSKVKIRVEEDKVSVTLLVNTIKQIVTQKEYELWVLFMDNYEKFIQEGIDYKQINKCAKDKIKRKKIAFFLLLMLSVAVCVGLGTFLTIMTDSPFYMLISIVLSLSFFAFIFFKKLE